MGTITVGVDDAQAEALSRLSEFGTISLPSYEVLALLGVRLDDLGDEIRGIGEAYREDLLEKTERLRQLAAELCAVASAIEASPMRCAM